MALSNSSSLLVLQLIGAPGITPSRVRSIIEAAMKRNVRAADILTDKDQIRTLLTCSEIEKFYDFGNEAAARYQQLLSKGVTLISIDDDGYPTKIKRRLRGASPPLFFTKGNLEIASCASVGFCGSRKASLKGLQVAVDCAQQICKSNINVVSGYAAGVDIATHKAALECGGTTTIVLPDGIDHFRIRREIKEYWDWSRVLVMSQFFPSVPWRVENAMKRNEVICALSDALIVIEAGSRGGSLEAGRTALAKSVPVYAPVYEGMPVEAVGNRELLQRGAQPIFRSKSTNCASLDRLLGNVLAPGEQADLFSPSLRPS